MKGRQYDAIGALLDRGESSAAMLMDDDRPLPFWALEHADRDLLVALLDRGLPPDTRDARGNGLLHQAALAGDAGATALLLERGANPNRRDLAGNTPLHYAAYWQRVDVARLLVARDASDALANLEGRTPREIAAASGNTALAAALASIEPNGERPQ